MFVCWHFVDEGTILKYSIIQGCRQCAGFGRDVSCKLEDGHSTKAENKDEYSSEVTQPKVVKTEYYSGMKCHMAGRHDLSMCNWEHVSREERKSRMAL